MTTEHEENIRKVEQVFETNLYDKTGDVLTTGIPSQRSVFISFISSIISLTLTITFIFIANSFFRDLEEKGINVKNLSLNLKNLTSMKFSSEDFQRMNLNNENLETFYAINFLATIVLLYASSFIAICSVMTLAITLVVRIQDNRAYINFWKFALAKNTQILKLNLSFVLYRALLSIFIKNYQSLFMLSSINLEAINSLVSGGQNQNSLLNAELNINDNYNDSFIKTLSDFLSIYIKNLISSIIVLLLVYLIKELILQFINYRIHYQYYKKRVVHNEKIVRYLNKLNKSVPHRMNPDLVMWSSLIFRSLDKRNEGLRIGDFVRYFGPDGPQIFKLFDTNADEIITEDEFIKRYISIFNERRELQSALDGNAEEMKKLNSVLLVTLYPLSIVFIISIIMELEAGDLIMSISGTVLSLSFAFGPVVSDILGSLIFIFLVRPYDIGDKITIDDVHYTVGEMGLLYSTLFHDSKYHSFSNSELMSKKIINLRRSNFITVTIKKRMKYQSSINKMPLLKDKIKKFLAENRNMYGQKFTITDYEIHNDVFSFAVRIMLSCPYQEIVSAKKRKDMLAVFVHESLMELGFEYAD